MSSTACPRSFPDQTLEITNRRFSNRDGLVLLLVDENKVKAPIKHEGALSGRAGTFPHIYGPLNVDAVYATAKLEKDKEGKFIEPCQRKRWPELGNRHSHVAACLEIVNLFQTFKDPDLFRIGEWIL